MATSTSVYFRVDTPAATDDESVAAARILLKVLGHTDRLIPLNVWVYTHMVSKPHSTSYNPSTRTLRICREMVSCSGYALLELLNSSNIITENALRGNILEALKGLPPRYMDDYAKWTFTSLNGEDFWKVLARSELSASACADTDDEDEDEDMWMSL